VELKDKNELLVWKVTFTGPANSPYDKGVFDLEVDLRQVCEREKDRVPIFVFNVNCFVV